MTSSEKDALPNLTVQEAARKAIDHNELIKARKETEELSDDQDTLLKESIKNAVT